MTDTNGFELSRRKVLAGIGGVGVTSAGAGMGTSAYFSDAETFEDNALTAGELDLRIDWQQLYWGMPDDHYMAPYGSAGRPFVSAHPDHDDDGMQSLDLSDFDEGEFADRDDEVRYTDEDANIQEYLTCETLTNFEDPDDFDNDNLKYDPEALIDLADIKPGDRGEVTFSLHLCDNPGYVWIGGEPSELEFPLADRIRIEAWYDVECDNEFNKEGAGDSRIVGTPSRLSRFLEDLEKGHQLTPDAYPHVDGIEVDDGDDDTTSARTGEIEWMEDGLKLTDDTDGKIDVTGTDPLEYTVVMRADGDTMILRLFDLYLDDYTKAKSEEDDLSRVQEFDWEIIDEYDGDVTDVAGVYELEIESQGGELCDCYVSPCADDGNVWPFTDDTIASTEWFHCKADPELCFPADETFCVAFAWEISTRIGNEIQNQSASWDLQFYTEQCRHNPYPNGPP